MLAGVGSDPMREWLHPRGYFLSDERLQRLQDFSDSADFSPWHKPIFAPWDAPIDEPFSSAGFTNTLRLAQKWRHWALDASTLREIIYFPRLSSSHRTPPTVSEQVLAALHILAAGPTTYDTDAVTGVASHAQLVLSRQLMRFPVLMHPLMRLPMEDAVFNGGDGKIKTPTVALTQAICVTTQGRFPLAEDGFTQRDLHAFYNHPCTRLGLFEPPVSARGKPDHSRAILWQSVCDVLVEDIKPLQPGLFASLHQAHKALGDRAPDRRFTAAFEPDTLSAARFAQAFQRSNKLLWGREHQPAISSLRELGAGSNSIFRAIVAKNLVGDMFSERLHEIDGVEYEARIRDVLHKVCDVGIAVSIKDASVYLLRAVQDYSKDPSFQAALPSHAFAFLQLLVDDGRMRINPDGFVQPQWRVAAHAVANAVTMREAIQSQLSAANEPTAPAASRRRRTQI